MNHDEWNKFIEERAKHRKDKAQKKRLMDRQKRLRSKLYGNRSLFRVNDKLQTELRRVAALCIKLDVRLDPLLEREIIQTVMDS
jgi:hypothetical protein